MKKLNGRTIVFAAVLVAMNLVLSRVLAINIGPTIRITISATESTDPGIFCTFRCTAGSVQKVRVPG